MSLMDLSEPTTLKTFKERIERMKKAGAKFYYLYSEWKKDGHKIDAMAHHNHMVNKWRVILFDSSGPTRTKKKIMVETEEEARGLIKAWGAKEIKKIPVIKFVDSQGKIKKVTQLKNSLKKKEGKKTALKAAKKKVQKKKKVSKKKSK